jgi:hypothetical protein
MIIAARENRIMLVRYSKQIAFYIGRKGFDRERYFAEIKYRLLKSEVYQQFNVF